MGIWDFDELIDALRVFRTVDEACTLDDTGVLTWFH